MRVKALVWERCTVFSADLIADTPIRRYRISTSSGLYFGGWVPASIDHPFDTIDQAKAAAQADFERRVMECLEVSCIDFHIANVPADLTDFGFTKEIVNGRKFWVVDRTNEDGTPYRSDL